MPCRPPRKSSRPLESLQKTRYATSLLHFRYQSYLPLGTKLFEVDFDQLRCGPLGVEVGAWAL